MKKKISVNLLGVISAAFLLFISISLLKGGTANNFSIFEVCFFSALLGINLIRSLKLYVTWKQARNGDGGNMTMTR